MDICSICGDDLNNGLETVVLTTRGCEGITNASHLRGDSLTVSAGQAVHKKCRQKYTNAKDIASYKRKHETAYTAIREYILISG